MKRIGKTVVLMLLVSALSIAVLSGCEKKEIAKIIVAGKETTEQYILADMVSLMIKENTDLDVDVKGNLTAKIAFDAIKANEVDVYAEYTGSGLMHLGIEPMAGAQEVFETVKGKYDEQFNIKWLEPLGFNNTYAMMVTKETAEKYNLKTTTDLAKVADELVMGCPYAFIERIDGYPGLSEHYDFEFADVKGMDTSLMYQAVVQGSVDVIPGYTTDGRVASLELVVLDDDQEFFPPYDAALVVRGEVLEEYPELEEVLRKLEGRITEEKMIELNGAVDLDKREPSDVAREFLEKEGLIKP